MELCQELLFQCPISIINSDAFRLAIISPYYVFFDAKPTPWIDPNCCAPVGSLLCYPGKTLKRITLYQDSSWRWFTFNDPQSLVCRLSDSLSD
jgi:hypothetical protein